MLPSIREFESRVMYVKDKIEIIKVEDGLLAIELDERCLESIPELARIVGYLKNARLKKKQFDYALIIVATYGALENFIESTAKDYLSVLQRAIPKYSLLPDVVKAQHVPLSVEYLQSDYKYKRFGNQQEFIKNLNDCLLDSSSYRLNILAYTRHTTNFRCESTNDFFGRLGVVGLCKSISLDEEYKAFALMNHGMEHIEHREILDIFSYLDDLAERRNEVAHGYFPDELLSLGGLESLVESILCFARCLSKVVVKHIATNTVGHSSIKLGSPIACYRNSIACFKVPSKTEFSTGMWIVAFCGDDFVAVGQIDNIQIDCNDVSWFSSLEDVDVAFKIGIPAKNKYLYFLLVL